MALRKARLDRLDETCLNLGSADEPWTIHLEVRIDREFDEERLRAAIRQAMVTHPIARAHLKPVKPATFRYYWLIPDEPGVVPLAVVSGEPVAAVRDRVVSEAPDLGVSTFTATAVRAGGGDYLMLVVHHAAGDGVAAYRLMTSILRNYSGEPDPVPGFDQVAVRNVHKLVGSRGLKDRLERGRMLGRHMIISTRRPVRVAPQNGTPAGGYGCHPIFFSVEETQKIVANRPDGVTVNDLLLGGLAMTVRRWNDDREVKPRRVTITMPMNVRPSEWQYEVFGNFASYVTIRVMKKEQGGLADAAIGAHARTSVLKAHRAQGIIVDIAKVSRVLPDKLKRMLAERPFVGDRAVDTTWLTNLGRLDAPGMKITEFWFSPPGTMPMGANIGAATVNGQLFVTLRYRHPQFDAVAAAEFADLYRDILLGR